MAERTGCPVFLNLWSYVIYRPVAMSERRLRLDLESDVKNVVAVAVY